MDLAARKYNFIQELVLIDESLLEKLEIVLKKNKEDWFNELSVIEKNEIETGLNQANNEVFSDNETVMKKFIKWQ